MFNHCIFTEVCLKVYTADSRCTCAGPRSCYSYERWTYIRLTALCTNLRQSEMYLRQFTIAGCRGLFLSMFKNNLRFWGSSALICSDLRPYKSPGDPVCSLFESYLRQSALLCTHRSADSRRLTQLSGMPVYSYR